MLKTECSLQQESQPLVSPPLSLSSAEPSSFRSIRIQGHDRKATTAVISDLNVPRLVLGEASTQWEEVVTIICGLFTEATSMRFKSWGAGIPATGLIQMKFV